MTSIPELRLRVCNAAPVRRDGAWVLYWMVAARRTTWNFGLQRAVEHARTLGKPLLVLEALRCDARWASDRIHRFVLDGMADNARRLDRAGIRYFPYVEPKPGAGKGLLAALATRACVVVTDEFPSFFLPHMLEAAAGQVPVRLEAVDSNGLLPLRATPHAFTTAYSFRRFLQKNLRPHLEDFPAADPLKGSRLAGTIRLPREVTRRWPPQPLAQLGARARLASLPIDHDVQPAATPGGSAAAGRALRRFLAVLPRYATDHNAPEADGTSGLSAYLHFGHIAVHHVFHAIMEREDWTPHQLAPRATGRREGWWGTSAATEAFLDQIVTWRELGSVMAFHRPDHDRYESLPEWARATLEEHAGDRREHVYGLKQFEAAATHDPLWNAAQSQLRREGRIHNYLRMLWGKKILEWSASPRQALDIMIELNNKWALDGRDPNSYSGIFWVLGRYDRPWAPERPIFGTIRWMSSANTARKYRVREYLARYASEHIGRTTRGRVARSEAARLSGSPRSGR